MFQPFESLIPIVSLISVQKRLNFEPKVKVCKRDSYEIYVTRLENALGKFSGLFEKATFSMANASSI